MKAVVDATKCSGYGNCADVCPSVFDIDDWGYASVLGDGTVPEDDEDSAREAEAACPEKAIAIQD